MFVQLAQCLVRGLGDLGLADGTREGAQDGRDDLFEARLSQLVSAAGSVRRTRALSASCRAFSPGGSTA